MDCRCHVHSDGRVGVGELVVGHRACRPGARAPRVAEAPESEAKELAQIYVARGLTKELARHVAEQLKAHGVLGAHARDELGISEHGHTPGAGRTDLGGNLFHRRRHSAAAGAGSTGFPAGTGGGNGFDPAPCPARHRRRRDRRCQSIETGDACRDIGRVCDGVDRRRRHAGW
ncbi:MULTISPECIES: VIT1/CCC1 transporter family protein [unclassified Rhodanobacter]|uniref:VIT1/CCC1 transporter family protein n=1 Tax=Rhodanobacter humi TaxID=1888173 RepID=A0ABV4AT02_9GAMM